MMTKQQGGAMPLADQKLDAVLSGAALTTIYDGAVSVYAVVTARENLGQLVAYHDGSLVWLNDQEHQTFADMSEVFTYFDELKSEGDIGTWQLRAQKTSEVQ